jgi:hypothetical protein
MPVSTPMGFGENGLIVRPCAVGGKAACRSGVGGQFSSFTPNGDEQFSRCRVNIIARDQLSCVRRDWTSVIQE